MKKEANKKMEKPSKKEIQQGKTERVKSKGSSPSNKKDISKECMELFSLLDSKKKGYVTRKSLVKLLEDSGFKSEEPSFGSLFQKIQENPRITPQILSELLEIKPCTLKKAIQRDLIIPDFKSFSQEIARIYQKVRQVNDGKVAHYIPQLSRVDPNLFGVSICTIDGQQCNFGDYNTPFTLQSVSKPINYCLAVEESGRDYVHRHVGMEPSGRGFNELILNSDGLAHNPMTNAGAITISSLLYRNMEPFGRLERVLNQWQRLNGNRRPSFDFSIYLSEHTHATRNYAIAYLIKEQKILPANLDLEENLKFYFQLCSVNTTTDWLSYVGATLANSGECPLTGDVILKSTTVVNCLSLMYSCGMYDYSGEFAFKIGLPAKSGVSGGTLIIIPSVCGIGIFSPPLDRLGNPVKGLKFCEELVDFYEFHTFEKMMKHSPKKDPVNWNEFTKC